jgi:serine/threonine protein phosphatase PrpC
MARFSVELGSDSNVGRVREHNEDAWEHVSYSGGDFALVCDGMGGHEAGDLASSIAVRTLTSALVGGAFDDPRELLYRALERAHEEVRAAASAAPGRAGMGTTAVVALLRSGALFLGHVGDSRAYLVRDGVVSLLTRDQTKVQELVDGGLITAGEAKHHPDAGVLAQAIGMARGLSPFVTPEETGIPLRTGDVVVLCSDGVYDALETDEMAALTAQRSARDAARTLVSVAVERDGQDNATAVVAAIREAPEDRAVPPTVVDAPLARGARPRRTPARRSPPPGGSARPVGRPSTLTWVALIAFFAGLAFLAGRVTAARSTGGPGGPHPPSTPSASSGRGSPAVPPPTGSVAAP